MVKSINCNLTETEFINREVRDWGFDYIESLLERGYKPVLTSKGWSWILPTSVPNRRQLITV